jgi:hypothetical protein
LQSAAWGPHRCYANNQLDQELRDGRFIPFESVARPFRNDCLAIANLQRLAQERVGPVDLFKPMPSGARGKEMGADLGQEV